MPTRNTPAETEVAEIYHQPSPIMVALAWITWLLGIIALVVVFYIPPEELGVAPVQLPIEDWPSVTPTAATINNLWVVIALILVALMQPGFALVESGYLRAASATNVLFKNTIDFCINGVAFFLVGYSLMWNGSSSHLAFYGEWDGGWLLDSDARNGLVPPVHFLFHLMFASTAATICSGLVAGRIRLEAFFLATLLISCVIYPVAGYWVWGETENGPLGWLKMMGYHDLAGASVVHVVGGFAGLAGAIVLGPRLGNFPDDPRLKALKANTHRKKDGTYAIPGLRQFGRAAHQPHNFTSIALGTFLLWIGWFGFNGGSISALAGGGQGSVGFVLINTMLAACGGGLIGAVAPYLEDLLLRTSHKKYDVGGMLNGILGGLVAITACADLIKDPVAALMIGMVAGLLVYLTNAALRRLPGDLKIDDPVGAFGVHGICGLFGILCCALFEFPDFKMLDFWARLWVQFIGVVMISGWAFLVAFTGFWSMKQLPPGLTGGKFGLNSSDYDEVVGLDQAYHRVDTYTLESLSGARCESKSASQSNDE